VQERHILVVHKVEHDEIISSAGHILSEDQWITHTLSDGITVLLDASPNCPVKSKVNPQRSSLDYDQILAHNLRYLGAVDILKPVGKVSDGIIYTIGVRINRVRNGRNLLGDLVETDVKLILLAETVMAVALHWTDSTVTVSIARTSHIINIFIQV
jgi:hypothetical protein